MESRLKCTINRELRSTRQETQNLNDFSFQQTSLPKQISKDFQITNLKKSVPVNLTRVKSETLLFRKRSCEFSLNLLADLPNNEESKNLNPKASKNQAVSTKNLEKKATSDPNILKSYDREFAIDIDQKRKKLTQRKKDKINFINDKINKLKNINDKLNSLKDEILHQLVEEKQTQKDLPKHYYIGDLIKESKSGASVVQKNSAHFTHFQNGFNILKHLEAEHHIISRPQACQKTLKSSPIVQPLPTLVLDLDQTLVWTQKTDKLIVMNSIYLKDKASCRNVRHEVHLRPYVDKFLEEASKMFEIVIFTAGSYEYTNQIIKLIDPSRKFISRVLTRQHATKFSDEKYEVYVKDLRILGKNLNRTVFVDNCIYSYAMQLDNGIPILPFNGDPTDCELQSLLGYLSDLQNYSNMAQRNDEIFKQSHIQAYFNKKIATEGIVKSLYQNDNIVRNEFFHNS